ncbi:RNA polymerase sigma factor [Fulvivirga lutea]|uniref:Sigma-70 family RNA polymerase sigma factor n=1 Tax=Fulvivirga lutea TaxID=2810512 RepID=A0A974WI46_9BACT|nr:sigma-70 family RNA polymerase sigma factor [Fulvivirga lutea]QSE98183.1 sigma-70 family RNA polymerase sigma factor [Fulvivirga lutea]
MDKTITLGTVSDANYMSEQELANEQDLIARAKRDAEAFGEVYNRYFERIFNFILRRTDDEAISDDLTSQTFLKAMQSLKRYEYRGVPFSAWLYRIAHNEVNKYYNKQKRKKVFSLEQEQLFEFIQPEEEAAFDEEKLAELMEVLKELPTEAVEVLELRFFEEKNFKEISYILNIGESGAKMRLYRAIDKLKERFKIKYND